MNPDLFKKLERGFRSMRDDVDGLLRNRFAGKKVNYGQVESGGAVYKTVTKDLTAAQIISMFTTPIEIIPATAAGFLNIVDSAIFSFTYGGTQFTGGGNVRLEYAVLGAGVNVLDQLLSNSVILAAANSLLLFEAVGNQTAAYAIEAINITTSTAAFATGNGTLRVAVSYRVVPL